MSVLEKVCLGTVQFGLKYGVNNKIGLLSDDEIFQILDFSFQNGIIKLDSADAYGSAINVIGRYHRQSSNKFEINSKFTLSSRGLESVLEETLTRLHIDRLNLYQFHDYNEFEKNPNLHQQLIALKKSLLVEKIGVSVYSCEEMFKLSEFDFIDVIQFPFNLLDNHRQRQEAMKLCVERGKTLHARSVFLQGLFYKGFDEYPDNLRKLLPYMKKLREISLGANIPMSQLALNYALQQSNVDTVIIGVDSLTQLKENMENSLKLIPISVIDEINKIDVKEAQLLFPKNW
jgi:aryl-alcohol dehydrogenase-like predicted oxidoreductase